MATWAEIGIFWGALAAAVAAASAVAVSYFVYRSQTDPDVIVYVTTDPNRQGIVNLVIENIGRGVAKNVRFTISHPIPLHAFNGKPPEAMNRGPFVSGIPSLGPGARRVITWGQYFGLSAVLGRRVIRVTASYESDTQLPWAEHQLTRESFLDVMSFEGTDISDSNYAKQAASHLESLARNIERLVGGSRSISVQIRGSAGGEEDDPDAGLDQGRERQSTA